MILYTRPHIVVSGTSFHVLFREAAIILIIGHVIRLPVRFREPIRVLPVRLPDLRSGKKPFGSDLSTPEPAKAVCP